jgi:hypothetical protein
MDLFLLYVLKDYRALSIFCILGNLIGALLYLEYVETPIFLYSNKTFRDFYDSLKFILEMNFQIQKIYERHTVLRSYLFNIDDPVLNISKQNSRNQSFHINTNFNRKLKKPFIDDTNIDISQNQPQIHLKRPLSEKGYEESAQNLQIIEATLFNEQEQKIEDSTLQKIYKIRPFKTQKNHSSEILISLSFLSLLVYFILGIFFSHGYLKEMEVFPQFWTNLLFAVAIFMGVVSSSIFTYQNISSNILIYHLIAILVITVNMNLFEFSEHDLENELKLISFSHLEFIHVLFITAIMCSGINYLLIFIIGQIRFRRRGVIMGWAFALSFVVLAVLNFNNSTKRFFSQIKFKMVFFCTFMNILVSYFMPNSYKSKR